MAQSYADRHSAARVLDPVTMRPTGETRPTRGRKRGKPKCKKCGKEFSSAMISKFCSRECYDAYQDSLLFTKTCTDCDKEFRTATKHKKFCSRECKNKVHRERQQAKRDTRTEG